MKLMNRIVLLAAAIVLGASLSVHATITLQLVDPSGYSASRSLYGFTATGVATIAANEWIGIYKFTSTGTEGPSSPFWSTCLSPDGRLDSAPHNYTSLLFGPPGGASPGQYPSKWAPGPEGDAGIQNAQYLWRLLSPTIIASGTQQQGAGLALAMLEALYESASYGVLGAANNFTVTTWVGGTGVGTAYDWYTTYLGKLNATDVSANLGHGYVLRSTETGAGQDLIWNVTPVPEPTTIIAGALLLLPFGASTLRVLRKNRKA